MTAYFAYIVNGKTVQPQTGNLRFFLMSFLNPFFLVSLVALTIPVVIHLINLRKPQKLAFSTTAFFRELQRSTIRRLKIKKWLLLAMRALAVLLLALALARPFLEPQLTGFNPRSGDILYTVVVDNSPRMGQIDEEGPYYEQAVEFAEEIIDRAGSDDRFLIVPTHGEIETRRAVSRNEAYALLEEIEPANQGNYTRDRMRFAANAVSDTPLDGGTIYWIGDGGKTSVETVEDFDWEAYELDRRQVPLHYVKVGTEYSGNVGISSVESPNQIVSRGLPVSVEVEVTNYGEDPIVNHYVELEAQGRSKGQYEVELDPGQSRSYVFEVVPQQAGTVSGQARLDGDQFSFDNTRYFSLQVPETQNLLLVYEDRDGQQYKSYLTPVLEAALETSAQLEFEAVELQSFDVNRLADADGVILEGLTRIPEYLESDLQSFVQQGNGLILFPSETSDIDNYNSFLDFMNAGQFTGMRGDYARFEQVAGFDRLVEGHPILDEIFEERDDDEIRITTPRIFYHWIYDTGERSANTVFQTNLNEPLLTEHSVGSGRLIVSSMGVDPGWSNFPVNPLFAPVYYRTALYATAYEDRTDMSHTLGSPFEMVFNFESSTVEIDLNDIQLRPETEVTGDGVRVTDEAMDWQPGLATVSAGEQESVVAVNQHISESDFSTLELTELEEFLETEFNLIKLIDASAMSSSDLDSTLQTAGFGTEVWNWFIWLAILFLIMECIISRLYRAESNT